MAALAHAHHHPGRLSGGQIRQLVIEVSHADLDIDDGFGRKPGDGGGADVVDPDRCRTERSSQPVAPIREAARPGRCRQKGLNVTSRPYEMR